MMFIIKISEQQAFAIASRVSEQREWGTPLRVHCNIGLRYKMCRLHWYIEGKILPEVLKEEEWPFVVAIDVEQGTIVYACSRDKFNKKVINSQEENK